MPRVILTILLLIVALPVVAFCLFGLLATLEPGPGRWTWRGIYLGVELLTLIGLIVGLRAVWKPSPTP